MPREHAGSTVPPLCHLQVCVGGGDVTNCHNLLRNAVYEASLSVRLEAGGGLGKDKALNRPADILVSNPSGSASAAYDITVTSPLNPSIILEAGVSAGTAAKAAEVRKHSKYDVKCSELGWRYTPLAVKRTEHGVLKHATLSLLLLPELPSLQTNQSR